MSVYTPARVTATYAASGTTKPTAITTAETRLASVAAWSATGPGYAKAGTYPSLPDWPPVGTVSAWLDAAAVAWSKNSATANAASSSMAIQTAQSLIDTDLRAAIAGDITNILNDGTNGILPRLQTAVIAFNAAPNDSTLPALTAAVDGLYTALGWERSVISDLYIFGVAPLSSNADSDSLKSKAVAAFGSASQAGWWSYYLLLFGPYTTGSVPLTKAALDQRIDPTPGAPVEFAHRLAVVDDV